MMPVAEIGVPEVRRGALLLFHYWLPVLLGWSLVQVIAKAEGTDPSRPALFLLLSGIGAAYSFDRISDGPQGGRRDFWLRGMLWIVFVLCCLSMLLAAAVGKITSSILAVALLLSLMSVLYPHLKRIPLLKTGVVTCSWVWACSSIPFHRMGFHWLLQDTTLPLMLLVAAGCILCDLKDEEEDRMQQISSLPVLLGVRSACLIASVMAVLAAILAALHHRFALAEGASILIVAAQFPALLARESIGPIVIDSILILPGVLIALGMS